MELLPSYVYKIRQEVNDATVYNTANLTRGQFNTAGTGHFIGFISTIPYKDVFVLCQCQKSGCDNSPFWDSLDNIEESGIALCQVCENPVTVCQTGKRANK